MSRRGDRWMVPRYSYVRSIHLQLSVNCVRFTIDSASALAQRRLGTVVDAVAFVPRPAEIFDTNFLTANIQG